MRVQIVGQFTVITNNLNGKWISYEDHQKVVFAHLRSHKAQVEGMNERMDKLYDQINRLENFIEERHPGLLAEFYSERADG